MNKYPTDEELELFINQMEQQELYAPRHMKEQILDRAFPKQTEPVQFKSGSGPGKSGLLAYRLKIVVGMAAAVFMLLLLPSLDTDRGYDTDAWENEDFPQEDENRVYINSSLNDSVRDVNQKMNDWFGKLNFLQGGNLYDN